MACQRSLWASVLCSLFLSGFAFAADDLSSLRKNLSNAHDYVAKEKMQLSSVRAVSVSRLALERSIYQVGQKWKVAAALPYATLALKEALSGKSASYFVRLYTFEVLSVENGNANVLVKDHS